MAPPGSALPACLLGLLLLGCRGGKSRAELGERVGGRTCRRRVRQRLSSPPPSPLGRSVRRSVGPVRGLSRTSHPPITPVVAGAVLGPGPPRPSPLCGRSRSPLLVPSRSQPRTPPRSLPAPRSARPRGIGPPWRLNGAEQLRGPEGSSAAPAGVCPPVQRGGARSRLFVSPAVLASLCGSGGLLPPGRHVGVAALGCRLLHQPIQHLNLQTARSVPSRLCFQLETPLARGAPGKGPWCLWGPRPRGQRWGGMGGLPCSGVVGHPRSGTRPKIITGDVSGRQRPSKRVVFVSKGGSYRKEMLGCKLQG